MNSKINVNPMLIVMEICRRRNYYFQLLGRFRCRGRRRFTHIDGPARASPDGFVLRAFSSHFI